MSSDRVMLNNLGCQFLVGQEGHEVMAAVIRTPPYEWSYRSVQAEVTTWAWVDWMSGAPNGRAGVKVLEKCFCCRQWWSLVQGEVVMTINKAVTESQKVIWGMSNPSVAGPLGSTIYTDSLDVFASDWPVYLRHKSQLPARCCMMHGSWTPESCFQQGHWFQQSILVPFLRPISRPMLAAYWRMTAAGQQAGRMIHDHWVSRLWLVS